MEYTKHIEIQASYMNLITHGGNLNDMCNFTAKLLGIPVALALTTRTLIAKSVDFSPNLVEEYVSSMELCSDDEIKNMHEAINSRLSTPTPFSYSQNYLRHKHAVCGCYFRSTLFAVITCPIIKKIKDDNILEILAIASPIFSTALQLNGYINTDSVFPMQAYLQGLLKGEISPIFQQRNLFNSPLEKIKKWRVLFGISSDPNSCHHFQNTIKDACSRISGMWYTKHEDGIVILMDAEQNIWPLHKICQDIGRIGVSLPYSNICDTPEQLHLIQLALHLSDIAEDNDTLIFVQKYQILIRYLFFAQNETAEIPIDAVIAEIKKYDSEHNSDYYETLRAYLLHERSIPAMAERLHIHRNTVGYRLQRLTELFHLNLHDCQVIANLYLSIFAIELKKGSS